MFTKDSRILSHRLTVPLTSIAKAVGDVLRPTFNQLIKSLFANGEQGFAYDPNDLSTMFQDAAGIVPVTGVGQPVGLVLDKSKGLVLGPELVTNGGFSGGASSLAYVSATSQSINYQNNRAEIAVSSAQNIGWFVFPASGLKAYEIAFDHVGGTSTNLTFNLYADGPNVYLHTYKVYQANSKNKFLALAPAGTTSLRIIVARDCTVGTVFIDNISVRELLGNHAYRTNSASRPILRKNAVTGANYLEFDGTDDFLQTSSINFTSTDKVSLFVGVRKLSDSSAGMVLEFSDNINLNTGTFYITAGRDYALVGYASASRGSATLNTNLAAKSFTYPSPDNAVLSATHNILGSLSTIRRNGVVGVSGAESKGAGTFGNYPLYIGRRGGTSLPFNGHIYGLIGVGKLVSNNETVAIEKELAKRTGVTLNV